MLPQTVSVSMHVQSSTILMQKMTEYTQKMIKNIGKTTTVMSIYKWQSCQAV